MSTYRGTLCVLCLWTLTGAVAGYVWGIGTQLLWTRNPSTLWPAFSACLLAFVFWRGGRRHFEWFRLFAQRVGKIILAMWMVAIMPPLMAGISFLSGDEHVRWGFPIFLTILLTVQNLYVLPAINANRIAKKS